MHASIGAAAAAGARGLWLGVNSQNARAIRFYEKSGFRKVGTKSFTLGNTVEHDFVMERPVHARDQADSPPGNGAGRPGVVASMKIEIWSDVACPWCYIGKRRFETALAAFPHRESVEVQWRSYQLDPSLPEHYDGTELDYLSTRKGMAPAQVAGMFAHVAEQAKGEGLNYRFDDVVVANSFTAHRLIHLAAAHGQQDAAKERLLSDHFEHGQDIGSREYLTSLGLDLGIDAGELDELFTTDKYADDVRMDFEEGRALGISGVPFFVIDRKFGLSGAQPAETFTAALEQAWQDSQPAGHGGHRPAARRRHRPARPAARTAAPSEPAPSSNAPGACARHPRLLTDRAKVSVCPGFRPRATPPNEPRPSTAS